MHHANRTGDKQYLCIMRLLLNYVYFKVSGRNINEGLKTTRMYQRQAERMNASFEGVG
jgi:hypothetical protein